jgi:hypothetical protein
MKNIRLDSDILKEMIVQDREMIECLEKSVESYNKDIELCKRRVELCEHWLKYFIQIETVSADSSQSPDR